jgi:hypothetical protein
MNCVEDAITFIDAMPLGEIVSVTVQKEQEVDGEEYIPYLPVGVYRKQFADNALVESRALNRNPS